MNYLRCLPALVLLSILCIAGGSKGNKTRQQLRKQQKIKLREFLTAGGKKNETLSKNTSTKAKKLKWSRKKKLAQNILKNNKHHHTSKNNTKHGDILKGKRKSSINIQGNQAGSPVVYTSPDGKDYYIFVRTNEKPQVNLQGTTPVPHLPSKTFLVTVYGEQLEGAEEKLRNALAKPPPPPKVCPTPSPCERTHEVCECHQPEHAHADQAVGLQMGGKKLVLFPNAGKPFGPNGCMCPCCMCSCSEPWYRHYDCGCQKSPPVPCPCSTWNSGAQPQMSTPADSNCQCSVTSESPCTCNANSFPVSNPSTLARNQVASWTGVTSSCPCSCCQCACAQPETYPNYHCGCANPEPTPCPCDTQSWNFDQSGAQNNVPRSPENSPPVANTVSQAPAYNPYPYPSTAENNMPRSPAYSPYPTSPPPNNGAVSPVFRSGNYQFENNCDCYCCPCSCPGTQYWTYDNSQCTCGQGNQAACTCRRSDVRGHHKSLENIDFNQKKKSQNAAMSMANKKFVTN